MAEQRWKALGADIWLDGKFVAMTWDGAEERPTAEQREHAALIARIGNAHDDLVKALEAATKELISERDCLCDSVTTEDGEYTDPADGEGIAELDALINQCQSALAKARS